jgi:two-component system nitrogen regulation response regulator GlnG
VHGHSGGLAHRDQGVVTVEERKQSESRQQQLQSSQMTQRKTDGSTVGLSGTDLGSGARAERSAEPVPTLTILYHPDLRRIGDLVGLSEIPLGRDVLISRYEPELARPGQLIGEPLADSYISRRPLRLRATDAGGLEILLGDSRTGLVAHGTSVLQGCVFTAEEVRRGVVLELSARIVLLLHKAPVLPPRLPPRFGLIGDSAGLLRVRLDVQRISDLEVPVLLRGATGTGKELVARAIHDASPRRGGVFLGVNLGAIPAALSASELFGSVKGAYTGSVATQEGYFRRASGGTLFLDEIGEAPPEVQVMLLRVLETGEFFPVGAQMPQRSNVRVIAATDADLEGKVSSGAFRAPLLHRLSGYEILLPPLCDRRDDTGRLLLQFLREEVARTGEPWRLDPDAPSCDPLWLRPNLVARLARYDWPGNVRQLRNVARQLVIGSRGLAHLEIGPQIERLLRDGAAESAEALSDSGPLLDTPAAGTQRPSREWRKPSDIGEDELLVALRHNRWDLKATSEYLRVSRTSLYALIEGCSKVRTATDLSTEEIARCHGECGGDLDAMVESLEVSKRALGRRLRELGLA